MEENTTVLPIVVSENTSKRKTAIVVMGTAIIVPHTMVTAMVGGIMVMGISMVAYVEATAGELAEHIGIKPICHAFERKKRCGTSTFSATHVCRI